MIRTLLPLILLGILVAPAAAPAQRVLSDDQWREDLHFLRQELPARHRNAFDREKIRVTRAQFDSAATALEARISALADHEITVELASLVAMLGDGHTRLTLPQDPATAWIRGHSVTPAPRDSSLFLNHLPVKLELFDDGLFVRAAIPDHRDLIGAQVLSIGSLPVDSALEAVRPVVSYDNEMGFKLIAPTLLVVPEVLHARGVSDRVDTTRLRVRAPNGEVRAISLVPVPLFHAPEFIEAHDLLRGGLPAPGRKEEIFSLRYLPEVRAIYVQVNQLTSDVDESMHAFARRVAAMIRDSVPERLILDLRHNSGGNNDLGRPLLRALTGSAVDRQGRIFVLIGRKTFSAAQVFVTYAETLTNAIFVGEPTGSSPSHFGDSRRVQLPNSGITVRISSRYHGMGGEQRRWIEAHIPVRSMSRDYFSGRDAALGAALAFPPNSDPRRLVRSVAETASPESLQRFCWTFAVDPFLPAPDAEAGVAECGFVFLDRADVRLAVAWFEATLAFLPRAAGSYYGLALARIQSGDMTRAKAALERALEIDPRNARALELMQQINRAGRESR